MPTLADISTDELPGRMSWANNREEGELHAQILESTGASPGQGCTNLFTQCANFSSALVGLFQVQIPKEQTKIGFSGLMCTFVAFLKILCSNFKRLNKE